MNFAESPYFYSLIAAFHFALFIKELRRWPTRPTVSMWIKAVVAALLWPVICVITLCKAYWGSWKGE